MVTSRSPIRGRARGSCGRARAWVLAACTLAASSLAACYEGAEEEGKEAPPGYPGGWCLETRNCLESNWICNVDGFYCYDITAPCEGMYCGWHGVCNVDPESKLPFCVCDPGYSNDNYSLYCEPIGLTGVTSAGASSGG